MSESVIPSSEHGPAIVLRGPPGAGKTPVAEELRCRLAIPSAFVRLDDGWCAGERRFVGRGRYEDLHDPAAVLIVELGWGEPNPPSFFGATMNPAEWISVLEADRRRVLMFLLWTPLSETLVRKAGRMDLAYAAQAHERYDRGNACSSPAFLARLGSRYHETVIDTSTQTINETPAQILHSAGLCP